MQKIWVWNMHLNWRAKQASYKSPILEFDMQKMYREHNKYIHMSIHN
jgi:hypothetical protein